MILAVQTRIKNIERQFRSTVEDSGEDGDALVDEIGQLQRKEAQRKQGNIVRLLQDQLKGSKNENLDVKEIAQAWLVIADVDGDGQLDKKELFDFFGQIDGINQSEEEITQIFDALDADQSGYLKLDEFAGAIYQVLYGDDDYEGAADDRLQ